MDFDLDSDALLAGLLIKHTGFKTWDSTGSSEGLCKDDMNSYTQNIYTPSPVSRVGSGAGSLQAWWPLTLSCTVTKTGLGVPCGFAFFALSRALSGKTASTCLDILSRGSSPFNIL